MTTLRVALVVSTGDGAYDKRTLRSWIRAGDVDLVVFPEGFLRASGGSGTLSAARDVAVNSVGRLAESLGAPVLAGVWCDEVVNARGMQCAAYWNPAPKGGDSHQHFYAKHSTSPVLPYELNDYGALREDLFRPISLNGHQLGVQLCHDQFFGLISDRLVRAGAKVLLDLTGTDVVRAKWSNVVAGRSLEYGVPYFCTMSRVTSETSRNVAFAFGFRDGAELIPVRKEESASMGDLVLFAIDGEVLPRNGQQPYSPKSYDDVTLALAPSNALASLRVGLNGPEGFVRDSWQPLVVGRRKVGVLSLSAEKLRDPLCIHAHEQGASAFDVNIVCFASRRDVLSLDDAIILARLRAVEHRVAIVICTPVVREVIKTSRFKNIQRIQEREGVFGIDRKFVGGTYATMQGSGGMGISKKYQADYRALRGP